MATIDEIQVNGPGPVQVQVTIPRDPFSTVGRVWRYTPAGKPDGEAGRFRTNQPTVEIGEPANVADNIFAVVGVVISQWDDPPAPYAVEVVVRQGSTVLKGPFVPPQGGQGSIGAKDVQYVYTFRVKVP